MRVTLSAEQQARLRAFLERASHPYTIGGGAYHDIALDVFDAIRFGDTHIELQDEHVPELIWLLMGELS